MLSEGLHPVLQDEMIGPGLVRGFGTVLPLITQINKAHVLMLETQRVLSSETARALAAAIIELEGDGPSAFALDPAREDAYFNYEAELIARVGSDIGGRVHIARSRNDLYATIDRLRARELSLLLGRGLVALRQSLIEQARAHRDVLMPGYTHMQPAQPLTFGYYLAGLAHALERDFSTHRRVLASDQPVTTRRRRAGRNFLSHRSARDSKMARVRRPWSSRTGLHRLSRLSHRAAVGAVDRCNELGSDGARFLRHDHL